MGGQMGVQGFGMTVRSRVVWGAWSSHESSTMGTSRGPSAVQGSDLPPLKKNHGTKGVKKRANFLHVKKDTVNWGKCSTRGGNLAPRPPQTVGKWFLHISKKNSVFNFFGPTFAKN